MSRDLRRQDVACEKAGDKVTAAEAAGYEKLLAERWREGRAGEVLSAVEAITRCAHDLARRGEEKVAARLYTAVAHNLEAAGQFERANQIISLALSIKQVMERETLHDLMRLRARLALDACDLAAAHSQIRKVERPLRLRSSTVGGKEGEPSVPTLLLEAEICMTAQDTAGARQALDRAARALLNTRREKRGVDDTAMLQLLRLLDPDQPGAADRESLLDLAAEFAGKGASAVVISRTTAAAGETAGTMAISPSERDRFMLFGRHARRRLQIQAAGMGPQRAAAPEDSGVRPDPTDLPATTPSDPRGSLAPTEGRSPEFTGGLTAVTGAEPETSPALDELLHLIFESQDPQDLATRLCEAARRLRVESPLVEISVHEKSLASWAADGQASERSAHTTLIHATAPGRGLTSVTVKAAGAIPEQDLRTLSLVTSAARHLAETLPARRQDPAVTEGLIGASRVMLDVKQEIQEVAEADGLDGRDLEHVLITGESGTGKEVVARLIHTLSGRKDCAFVPVNMSTVGSAEMADSSIFGHVAGAFTGATRARKGKIRQAERGTLFLDEIGECHVSVQAKLLRLLEYGDYTQVGGDEPQVTRVRCVLATNRDVRDRDRFREDLFHRCAQIHLPPLRARREDIPALARHFAAQLRLELTAGALTFLQEMEWPGNIRQLQRAIRTLKREGGGLVTTERAYRVWLRVNKPEAPAGDERADTSPVLSRVLLEGKTVVAQVRDYEAHLLRQLYEETGSVKGCLKRSGYSSRNTIHQKLKEYGIIPKC